MKPAPNVLIFDIETSLCIYAAYPSNKPQYLGADNLLQDWFMICVAWQWEGSNKVHSFSLLDDKKRFKKDPTDDYSVVKHLHEMIEDADAIVGHNMSKFDWKKFMARVIYHKLPPLKVPKIIDTLTQARKSSFSHNSLSFLTKKLALAEKQPHERDMWLRILKGDEKAVRECVKYCRADIPATSELYARLKPYMPSNALLNQNLWRADGIECCVACGSDNILGRGWRTTLVGKYKSYSCGDCGKYMQGKKNYKTVSIK